MIGSKVLGSINDSLPHRNSRYSYQRQNSKPSFIKQNDPMRGNDFIGDDQDDSVHAIRDMLTRKST